jgi:hypothetical protein
MQGLPLAPRSLSLRPTGSVFELFLLVAAYPSHVPGRMRSDCWNGTGLDLSIGPCR